MPSKKLFPKLVKKLNDIDSVRKVVIRQSPTGYVITVSASSIIDKQTKMKIQNLLKSEKFFKIKNWKLAAIGGDNMFQGTLELV